MDSSVIVLDSSDDEKSSSPLEKKSSISQNFQIAPKPNTFTEMKKERRKSSNSRNHDSLLYKKIINPAFIQNNLINTSDKNHRQHNPQPIKYHENNNDKYMPIIVSTESLSKKDSDNPILSSFPKNGSTEPRKQVEQYPNITITKDCTVLNTAEFFNIAKYGPVINIDDDEDDDGDLTKKSNSMSITVEVLEIEVEDKASVESFSLDSDENSEKENSEHLITKSINRIDAPEPVQKKAKLSDDLIVENGEKEESDCAIVPISCNNQIIINDKVVDESSENYIQPVFKQFLDLYLTFNKYDDRKQNIVDKLKMHYKAVDKNYMKSDEFCSFVKGKISEMKESPKQSILTLKEMVDELKAHRRVFNSGASTSAESSGPNEKNTDLKVQKKIKHLEKLMEILNRKIKKLDEAEVSSDDEKSAYILADTYKSRLVKVYKRLCTLKGERGLKKERRINHILAKLNDSKQLPDIVKLIKNCASKSEYWFPDFHDITNCVKEAVKNANLNWSDERIRNKAESIFIEIGTAIQQERKCLEFVNLCALIKEAPDPADNNPELNEILKRNRVMCNRKLDELFNKYTEIQFSSDMVAEEVSDNDTEDKSDDEESSNCR